MRDRLRRKRGVDVKRRERELQDPAYPSWPEWIGWIGGALVVGYVVGRQVF